MASTATPTGVGSPGSRTGEHVGSDRVHRVLSSCFDLNRTREGPELVPRQPAFGSDTGTGSSPHIPAHIRKTWGCHKDHPCTGRSGTVRWIRSACVLGAAL